MKNILNIAKAFTLAEVLITLGIIGIVASMTIPTLMNKTQDAEFKSAFRKNYSIISQAVMQAVNEDGTFDGRFTDENTFRDMFIPYLRVVKTCDTNDSTCWTGNDSRTMDYFLSGLPVTSAGLGWWYKNRPVVALPDGTLLQFAIHSTSCTGSSVPGMIAPYAGTVCGSINIDLNGPKKPNTWGRDMFSVIVQKDRIFPFGSSSTNTAQYDCNKTETFAGLACAEDVITNKSY